MAKLTKKQKEIAEKVEPGKAYPIEEATPLVMGLAKAKFTESIDIAVNLGVDPRKSDQVVRGASVLPHGTGKTVRVAVFAQGEKADEALAAGADKVGYEDLAEEVKAGQLDFDVVVASPDAMRLLGRLGQILGPRGLMPNPKTGTVTPDVASAVKNAKSGQVRFRTDKAGIIHCSVGKVGFQPEQIKENIEHFLVELKKLKPASSKGAYLRKLTLSSTMGPGVVVDLATLNVK
ncbi:MAG: 50S ribosomal protein L1 [Gammaproteobacteria bacterium]